MLTVLASIDSVLNIAKSVIGIGGIIFVHELGHFLVGRWCGVKAEAFSIGFGPVLWKWTPGETEYRLSAIPLGGYVKFLGENPDERGVLDPRSFNAATFPRKTAIMLAGVTMNVIAAFILFAFVFTTGWEAESPVIGYLAPGGTAWENGLHEGDVVVSMNSNRILDHQDISQETLFSDAVEVEVRRDGVLQPPLHFPTRESEDGIRRIGVGKTDSGVFVVPPPSDGAASGPDFRDGDRIVSVDGVPVSSVGVALRMTSKLKRDTTWTVERGGATTEIAVPWKSETAPGLGVELGSARLSVRKDDLAYKAGMRTGDVPVRVGSKETPTSVAFRIALEDTSNPGPAVVRRDAAEHSFPLTASEGERQRFANSVAGLIESGQVWATLRPGDGPARSAGLTEGPGLPESFRIASIDGTTVRWAAEVSEAVRSAAKSNLPVAIEWIDASGAMGHTSVTAAALPTDTLDIDVGALPRTTLVKEPNVLAAMELGLDRTHRWVQRIFSTLRSIVTGRVSGSKLSGPIMIAVGTYSQAKQSWADFFLFLGMISMNLAVLNVLPVPLLDGGQLAVHGIEKIRGRPIPENVLNGLQWTGLVMLLLLMVYVLKNDVVNLLKT